RQCAGQAPRQLRAEAGEGGLVGRPPAEPVLLQCPASFDGRAEVGENLVGNEERRLGRPAQGLLGGAHLIWAEGGAVGLERGVLVTSRACGARRIRESSAPRSATAGPGLPPRRSTPSRRRPGRCRPPPTGRASRSSRTVLPRPR